MKNVYIYDPATNKVKNKSSKKFYIIFICIITFVIASVISLFIITRNRVDTNELQSSFNACNSLLSNQISTVAKIFEENNNLFTYKANLTFRKSIIKNTKKEDNFVNKEYNITAYIQSEKLIFKNRNDNSDKLIQNSVIKQSAYENSIKQTYTIPAGNNSVSVTFAFENSLNLHDYIEQYYKTFYNLYTQKKLYLNSSAVKISDDKNNIALNLRGQIYAFDEFLQRDYNYDADFVNSSSIDEIYKSELNIFRNILNDCIKYNDYTKLILESGLYTSETVDFSSALDYITENECRVLGFTITGNADIINEFYKNNNDLNIVSIVNN